MEERFKFIDEGIIEAVQVLNKHGFITWESCQGGDGHCFELPTVRFWGNEFDLIRACRICENYDFKLYQANRVYRTAEIATGDTNICPKGEVWDVPFNEIIFVELPKLLKNN